MASPVRLLSRNLPALARGATPPQIPPCLNPILRSPSRSHVASNFRLLHCTAVRRALAGKTLAGKTLAGETSARGMSGTYLDVPKDEFARRHIGPSSDEIATMLAELKFPTLDGFVNDVVPPSIRSADTMNFRLDRLPFNGMTEQSLLQSIREIAQRNQNLQTHIGCGYTNTITPQVILRNVLENPGWYTSYTPYQAEISQGRLESLLNFQTVVTDLTGMTIANASVLDEATAASEAMTMSLSILPAARQKRQGKTFYVDENLHPQTIAGVNSRAAGLGIEVLVGSVFESERIESLGDDLIGIMVQYPATDGTVNDYSAVAELSHRLGAPLSVATDLLALTLLKPPGEWGADIVFGNSQRFGVPLGFGGPHAAFFATSEMHRRKIPGRLVGVSKDRLGNRALRLALQTREQHIRREKATSNICTAQALLANMAALYAVYHGPGGLKAIAERIRTFTVLLRELVKDLGFELVGSKDTEIFDTVNFKHPLAKELISMAESTFKLNLRLVKDDVVGITLDETTTVEELRHIILALKNHVMSPSDQFEKDFIYIKAAELGLSSTNTTPPILDRFKRTTQYLTQPVFNSYHSETEILRYIHHLQSKDLSLTHSMMPLGSCTMKLNATTEMVPISWPEFNAIHPFVPAGQAKGYETIIKSLEDYLAEITRLDAVSLQPNSGAQGEFTGLRVISAYFKDKGESQRKVCLIPVSAHGTNPASAALAGMTVVPIKCDPKTGNLDLSDLQAKADKHRDVLATIMITYPSTFGVFEPEIKKVCEIVHERGGLVYMDGANLNAQVGLCSPGEIGADVCHLNLHKTFCIPHGGGGPGVGPIAVKAFLASFLPGHPIVELKGREKGIPPVSSAPWGSAGILPITWSYITMMGSSGLTQATKVTLLNASYMASRLQKYYPMMYTNNNNRCAHEFILDIRGIKEATGIEAIDIAKRLQDYGFHAPTMNWPVPNTLMVEPTESENLQEMDRFCDALISIREEIREVEEGRQPRVGNLLKMAPHSQQDLLVGEEVWKDRPYTREKAAYPLPYLRERKFWPSVTRVDDVYGDSNLFCTCDPVAETE